MLRSAALLLPALIVTGCGPVPVEPRPWELDVPEGVREIVDAPVSDEERQGHRVDLIEDLVLVLSS